MHRAQFVPQMLGSISRFGLPANSTPENRRLACDLAALVLSWEKKRRAAEAAGEVRRATYYPLLQAHICRANQIRSTRLIQKTCY